MALKQQLGLSKGAALAARPASLRVRPARGSSMRVAAEASKEKWDVSRFAKTILFFNPLPSPVDVIKAVVEQPVKIIQSLSGEADLEESKSAILSVLAPTASADAPSNGKTDVILVAGATGGVGKRVVDLLLAEGKAVRALVRDVPKAEELLQESVKGAAPGASLEIVAADIAQKQTMLPEYFEGVRAVINCTAVKVAPKEGDTEDRAKYYQGIKFYDPQIVGDTPEAVEYIGLQNLTAAVAPSVGVRGGKVLLDAETGADVWGPLDDVVMGGASESGLEFRATAGEDGGRCAVFSGLVTEANNGGFCSVRNRNYDPPQDLKGYDALELRVLGNGLRYKCTLRTSAAWDSKAFCLSFDTVDGEWQTIKLPFKDFFPVFRAKTLKGADATPLDPSSIYSMQLMLSKFEYDGDLNPAFKAGPFQLPIQSIKATMAPDAPARFVHVGSAGVTRPNRPGIDVEVEPPAVKMNDMLGGILTFKEKGEDVVRASGMPFAVVRPTALTEEPAGAELEIDQGDTIKGKISRDDVAQLCVALLSETDGADTTFEIKSTVPFSQPWTVDPEAPPAPRDWGAFLGAAGLKKRVTGQTIDGVYTGKEELPAP